MRKDLLYTKSSKQKENTSPFSARSPKKQISDETLNTMMRERAYYLWEGRGRTDGDDFADWLRAEKEILAKFKK